MRLGYISDIHHEHDDSKIPVPEVDILILAGDIDVRPKGLKVLLKTLRSQTNAPILYIMGNHEYYNHTFPDIREQYRAQVEKVLNVHLLERSIFFINNVRFLGTTLWSDLSNPIHATDVQNGLYDFKLIHNADRSRFRASDCTAEWKKNAAWLEQELCCQYDGKTVVITHHSPSSITCASDYKYSRIRFGFHSDMEDLIFKYQPDIWIYGHDHMSAHHKLGETLLISNQAGYPHEGRKNAIIKIIEV